jgi:hypothetical protein
MLVKTAWVSVVVCLGCIDDGVEGQAGSFPKEEGAIEDRMLEPVPREKDPQATLDLCNKLAAGDGACAHACDPDTLIAYIPKGSCATFVCPLPDGTQYITGGCND